MSLDARACFFVSLFFLTAQCTIHFFGGGGSDLKRIIFVCYSFYQAKWAPSLRLPTSWCPHCDFPRIIFSNPRGSRFNTAFSWVGFLSPCLRAVAGQPPWPPPLPGLSTGSLQRVLAQGLGVRFMPLARHCTFSAIAAINSILHKMILIRALLSRRFQCQRAPPTT